MSASTSRIPHNWYIPSAPFVGDFGGFAKVFVAASFAYGGTESLGMTAGETKNPSQNMSKVVKVVFWRILIFYDLSILLIGLNVPWDYPDLSNKSTTTSPFTIVFTLAGSTVAASFMNTVILTSVLSAGNHALFVGTRVLYGLSVVGPIPHALRIFSWTTRAGVPLYALLATSSISVLCFGSGYIGSGQLWGWLQNIVGVSNQIAWLSIVLASWRFRKAWIRQGRSLDEMKFRASIVDLAVGSLLCLYHSDRSHLDTRMVLYIPHILTSRFHLLLRRDTHHGYHEPLLSPC
ncbi:hypothetical protein P692DRAFT_2076757 [Suillus brevipes Sb2]|nr:hypothetical protein P692DRAFT_2076757 [Suillus brevipes Sb2]